MPTNLLIRRPCRVWVWFIAMLAGAPAAASAQRADLEAEIRMIVARAEQTDAAVLGDDESTESLPRSTEAFRVQRVDLGTPGLMVWHVRPPISHAPPYTLAWDGQHILRLGGFAAPQLIEVAAILSRSLRPDSVARILARIADPQGGMTVVWPFRGGSGRTAEVASQWIRRRTSDWPSDTSFIRNGTRLVRLNVLTQDPNGHGSAAWYPKVYAFSFAEDGRLLAWTRTIGARFIESDEAN